MKKPLPLFLPSQPLSTNAFICTGSAPFMRQPIVGSATIVSVTCSPTSAPTSSMSVTGPTGMPMLFIALSSSPGVTPSSKSGKTWKGAGEGLSFIPPTPPRRAGGGETSASIGARQRFT